MRKLILTALSLTCTLALQSCASQQSHSPTQMASNFINSQSVTKTTTERYPAKNPQGVRLYTENVSPHTAYRVIGIAKVSKRNMLGAPRADSDIANRMKTLAASIGGDGLINLDANQDVAQAHVIAFQKILI